MVFDRAGLHRIMIARRGITVSRLCGKVRADRWARGRVTVRAERTLAGPTVTVRKAPLAHQHQGLGSLWTRTGVFSVVREGGRNKARTELLHVA